MNRIPHFPIGGSLSAEARYFPNRLNQQVSKVATALLGRSLCQYAVRHVFVINTDSSGNMVTSVSGFEEDPAKRVAITNVLKQSGFKWTPAKKAWVCPVPHPIEPIRAVIEAQKAIGSSDPAPIVAGSDGKQERSPFEARIADFLKAEEQNLGALLPKRVDKGRFFGSLKAALLSAERIVANSNDAAVFSACVKCAQLGMTPGPLQECYFSSRDGQIEFQLGYKGLIAMARKAIPDLQLTANVVRGGDEFKYVLGNNPSVELIQSPNANPEDIRFAYVMLTYPNGLKTLTVIDTHHVKKRKECSKGAHAPSSPWVKFPREMWLKTAIRDALRFANLSSEESKKEELKMAMDEFKDVLRMLQKEVDESESLESELKEGSTNRGIQS